MTSDEEGRIDLPPPRRHNTGAQPTLATTTPRPENPPTAQSTMTTPPRQATPQLDTDLPLERWRACREDAQWQSELADRKEAATTYPREPPRHEPPVEEERILMMDYTATQA
jgi:hypothetical protein